MGVNRVNKGNGKWVALASGLVIATFGGPLAYMRHIAADNEQKAAREQAQDQAQNQQKQAEELAALYATADAEAHIVWVDAVAVVRGMHNSDVRLGHRFSSSS